MSGKFRSIRSIALNRKNALFAGSDGGGENWVVIVSLIETAKSNDGTLFEATLQRWFDGDPDEAMLQRLSH